MAWKLELQGPLKVKAYQQRERAKRKAARACMAINNPVTEAIAVVLELARANLAPEDMRQERARQISACDLVERLGRRIAANI